MELLKYFLKIQTHRIFLEQISREELMVDFYLGWKNVVWDMNGEMRVVKFVLLVCVCIYLAVNL